MKSHKQILLIFCLVFALSCSKEKSDDPPTTVATVSASLILSFTQAAANALPQLTSDDKKRARGVGNISDVGTLYNFFKQECYMPSDGYTSYEGFCPNNVTTLLDTALGSGGAGIGDGTPLFNQYKLTSGTLIGLIYHAQMYSQGPDVSNVCSDYDANDLVTAHSPEFTGGTASPAQYIIDGGYFNTLACVKTNSWDGSTTYSTFGFDETASSISNLTSRYRVPYNGVSDPGQTDIFQVYVGLDQDTISQDTPTPKFLAFNFAGANTTFSRAIILTNLLDNKFAVRFSAAGGGGFNHIIAIGKGGVDKTTGTPVAGYYMVQLTTTDSNHLNPVTTTYCVNNSDNNYNDAVFTDCTAIPWSIAGTGINISAAAIATYLNMSAADQVNTTGFRNYFANLNPLAAANFPKTIADADANFPRLIR